MGKATQTKTRSRKKKIRPDTSDYFFDKDSATRAVKFFETQLHHVEDPFAGEPFKLQPWQKQIVSDVFGWKRKSDGSRKYRTVYIEVPRKNGKSTLGAGIALYLLYADKELGAQVVSAAADREQAAVIFELAQKMVRMNPVLMSLGVPLRRSIAVYKTGSSYKVLSAEAFSKHGKNLHGILFDELHAQPNRDLVDVLKTSTGTRKQPLQVYMTTAGYDRQSICWEYHDYATKVKEGIIVDESFYPVIYAAEQEDDWREPKTWAKANPNYGITIRADYLESECKKAIEVPAYENTFKRLHLNQWTEQESRLIPMDLWDATKETAVEWEKLKGRRCYGGLDLASTTDIAALSLVFPMDDGKVQVLPFFWVPKENADYRLKRAMVPYPTWIKTGQMYGTEGNVIDYEEIRRKILELKEVFDIREIAFDRWNAVQLTTQLSGDGIEMMPFGQGFASMSAPTKELLGLIMGKKLEHGGNPVLRWMATNVAGEQDAAGNLKPSKKKSKEKIDGIVATIMGIGRMNLKEAEGESVYKQRGFIAV